MVVARVSKFIVVCIALGLTPVLLRAITSPSVFSALWVLMAVAVVVRVNQIAVYVNDGWVVVRNFFKTTHVPVWEAEVELGEPEGGLTLSDAGGQYDAGGRTIYIRRQWHGDVVHVGVAPRYGKETQRIHDELVKQIQLERAA